jgi:hypothetical protein
VFFYVIQWFSDWRAKRTGNMLPARRPEVLLPAVTGTGIVTEPRH